MGAKLAEPKSFEENAAIGKFAKYFVGPIFTRHSSFSKKTNYHYLYIGIFSLNQENL